MKALPIDMEYLIRVLLRLLRTPSPTGLTDAAVRVACEELSNLDVPIELTRRGAIRANLSGVQYSPDRALIGHLDTLGAMVKSLKENGRLELVP
ncbi:MAG: osmoprotectant NAGGN system M42 family peptidase, partial [Pseudomonadota bacterium]